MARRTTSSRPRRVAILTNEALGLSGDVPNGFGQRYANVVAALERLGHERLVISVGPLRSQEPHPFPDGATSGLRFVPLDWSPSASKLRSYVDVGRSVVVARTAIGPGRDWERAVQAELAGFEPDVVLVLAPFRPSLCLLVSRATPVVLFAEEDLSHLGPSRGVTHLQRELALLRTRAPDVLVTVSEAERAWAQAPWQRRPVIVVPHGIDVDHWPTPTRRARSPRRANGPRGTGSRSRRSPRAWTPRCEPCPDRRRARPRACARRCRTHR